MSPIFYYVTGGIALVFFGWQWKLVRDTNKTPMQKYSVEQVIGNVEIRNYAPFVKAKVTEQGSYQEISYRSFQRLAGYIFGKNEGEQQIAMTTPVGMHYETADAQQAEMYFVMPEMPAGSNLPAPKDSSVSLIRCDGFRAAALRFGGVAGSETFKEKEAELRKRLNDLNIAFVDTAEWLRYNPPFQLFDRRNEVLFRIQ
jgi:hypothetical protein